MMRVEASGPALAAALVILFSVPGAARAASRSPTPAQTEGPYYSAGSPERGLLREAGTVGEPLRVTGRVLDRGGKPVVGARVDFWQADGAGRYDNRGYALRGHQITDSGGRYALDTVLPGLYPGRARHIHVKIFLSGRPPLTTQLYFSGDAGNTRDSMVDRRLLVELAEDGGVKKGEFDFVLDLER